MEGIVFNVLLEHASVQNVSCIRKANINVEKALWKSTPHLSRGGSVQIVLVHVKDDKNS